MCFLSHDSGGVHGCLSGGGVHGCLSGGGVAGVSSGGVVGSNGGVAGGGSSGATSEDSDASESNGVDHYIRWISKLGEITSDQSRKIHVRSRFALFGIPQFH